MFWQVFFSSAVRFWKCGSHGFVIVEEIVRFFFLLGCFLLARVEETQLSFPIFRSDVQCLYRVFLANAHIFHVRTFFPMPSILVYAL